MTSLNRLKVDHLVLECSRLETSQLESLKDIRQDLALGIGVIDIKSNLVESADVVAMRIEEAARKLGPERVLMGASRLWFLDVTQIGSGS